MRSSCLEGGSAHTTHGRDGLQEGEQGIEDVLELVTVEGLFTVSETQSDDRFPTLSSPLSSLANTIFILFFSRLIIFSRIEEQFRSNRFTFTHTHTHTHTHT